MQAQLRRHRAINETLAITQELVQLSDQADTTQVAVQTAQDRLHQALAADRQLAAQFQRLQARLGLASEELYAPIRDSPSSEATRAGQQPAVRVLASQQGVERPADTVRNAFALPMLSVTHTIPSRHQQDILPPQTPRFVHNQLGQFIQ
jgi:hypothetical protein